MIDFYYLANILTNINDLLKIYPHHLANTLTSINDIFKVGFCYLVNVLTNTNDKINNFTREEVDCV